MLESVRIIWEWIGISCVHLLSLFLHFAHKPQATSHQTTPHISAIVWPISLFFGASIGLIANHLCSHLQPHPPTRSRSTALVVCQLSSSHTWSCCLKTCFPVDPVRRSVPIQVNTCFSVPNYQPRACRPVSSTSASGQRELLLVLPILLISGC